MNGFVKKPIKCAMCPTVTAVPLDGCMWLTDDAAGFYPHGYRCVRHKTSKPDVHPQPKDAPPRLSSRRECGLIDTGDAA